MPKWLIHIQLQILVGLLICHDKFSDRGPGPIKPPLPGPKGGIGLRKIKNMAAVQVAVYNAIGVGSKNAVTRKDLKRITGYRDRLIRESIEALRIERVILNQGNGNGYYIPDTGQQGLRETIVWLEREDKRIESMKAATQGARKYIRNANKNRTPNKNRFPGQLNMFGMEVCKWENHSVKKESAGKESLQIS